MTSKVGAYALALGAGYLVCWLIAYSVLMDFDYRYLVEYFVRGWTGGGELPAGIQMSALILLVPCIAVGLIWHRVSRRRRERRGGHRPDC